MATIRVVLNVPGIAAANAAAGLERSPVAQQKYQAINRLQDILGGVSSGAFSGGSPTMQISIDGSGSAAAASGTVTCASALAADTVTINGVVFTAVASGATGNQFNVGGTDTAAATSLAAAINGSATALIQNTVSATSALGVVTISAKVPGVAGNAYTLASSNGSRLAVSGARLTGGTNDSGSKTYTY